MCVGLVRRHTLYLDLVSVSAVNGENHKACVQLALGLLFLYTQAMMSLAELKSCPQGMYCVWEEE